MLHPEVTIAVGSDTTLAGSLHEKAHHLCFIANSVNFAVRHEPSLLVSAAAEHDVSQSPHYTKETDMADNTTTTAAAIIPAMRYHDAPAAIEWLCKAFGFEKHLVITGSHRVVM